MRTYLSRERTGIVFAVPLPRGGFAYALSIDPYACFYDFITTHCTAETERFSGERLRFPVLIRGEYCDGVIEILDLGPDALLPKLAFYVRKINIWGDLNKPLYLRYEALMGDNGVQVDERDIQGLEEREQISGLHLGQWLEARRDRFELIQTEFVPITPLVAPKKRVTKDSLVFLHFAVSRLKHGRLPSDFQNSLDDVLQEKELGLVMGGGFFDTGECDVSLEILPGKVKKALRAIKPILKDYSEIATIKSKRWMRTAKYGRAIR